MLTGIALWVACWSVADFVLMGVEQRQAKKHRWRVPGKTFFLITLLGGSPGAILGMYSFHHKTRHWYCKWGLPAILVAQLALGGCAYWRFFLS